MPIQKVVDSTLKHFDSEVKSLSKTDYRDCIEEVISALEERLNAIEEELEPDEDDDKD